MSEQSEGNCGFVEHESIGNNAALVLTSEVPDREQQDCVVEEFICLRYSWFSTLVLKDQQRGRVDGSPTLGDFSQFCTPVLESCRRGLSHSPDPANRELSFKVSVTEFTA